jgi:hypothetical protein
MVQILIPSVHVTRELPTTFYHGHDSVFMASQSTFYVCALYDFGIWLPGRWKKKTDTLHTYSK